MKHLKVFSALAVLLFAAAIPGLAQTPAPAPAASSGPPGGGQAVILTATAKIVAIDSDARVVTLQDSQGNTQSIKVGPDVTRFNALKVGDTVTFRYAEAVAYAIAKPGAAPAAQATPSIQRNPGEKPGGTISQTTTALVTIEAMDPSVPSVTVKTQEGHTITMQVSDKSAMAGFKVGDTVQITYIQALAITVQ
jgi:Cu/Ag efflux protein CusF